MVDVMDNPGPETLLLCDCRRWLPQHHQLSSTVTASRSGFILIEMYPALRISATLVERLSDLALRAHYNDGHGGVTKAVLRDASHALRSKGSSERLFHLPRTP